MFFNKITICICLYIRYQYANMICVDVLWLMSHIKICIELAADIIGLDNWNIYGIILNWS